MQKGEKGYEGSVWDDEVPGRARKATLDIFATDESASVQVRFFFLGGMLSLIFDDIYLGYAI